MAEFRPAVREQVGLLIGLAGASGSGKTFSAMRLAQGIVGEGKRFAVIDTEARRALHYADRFQFDHMDMKPPFRPDAYSDAIAAADQAGYGAILIDSFSHVWAGEGGVLDWQEEELNRMAGQDWAKRERVKMAAWIKPKGGHKRMVQKLLQTRAHLIICLRAEEKTKIERGPDGKQLIVPMGFQPICDKSFPFELTCSALLYPDKPGVPEWLKLQEQHRPAFPPGQPITEESGKALAAWATGGQPAPPAPSPEAEPSKYWIGKNAYATGEEWVAAFKARITAENAAAFNERHGPAVAMLADDGDNYARQILADLDNMLSEDQR